MLLILAASAVGAMTPPHPRAAVDRAIAAHGPIVTASDNRLMATKCGLPASSRPLRNLRVEDGAIHCPDGRTVADAETRAMSRRIETRATAFAAAVTSDPAIKAAIDRYADAKAREAVRRLRER